jgi:hypothetical protein
MINDTRRTYLPVYVSTENVYFSQGILFLLEELFEDEFNGDVTISLVNKSVEADLIVQVQSLEKKHLTGSIVNSFEPTTIINSGFSIKNG